MALPATVYRGDGMACATYMREGSSKLLNPNHLLYGVIAQAAWRTFTHLVAGLSPMCVLQLFGFVTAALCLGLFCILLRQLHHGALSSGALTLCLGFTRGF